VTSSRKTCSSVQVGLIYHHPIGSSTLLQQPQLAVKEPCST